MFDLREKVESSEISIGAETSDRSSFFSLGAKNDRKGMRVIGETQRRLEHRVESHCEWESREGHYVFDQIQTLESDSITVQQKITILRGQAIQDLVIRFVLSKDLISKVCFGGEEFLHRNSNCWNQLEETEVKILTGQGALRIVFEGSDTLEGSVPVMYIRDFHDVWIVHCRVFPKWDCGIYWLRWMNRFGTWSVGTELSRTLRSLFPGVWCRLWYLSERKCGRVQFQAQGLIALTGGQSVTMKASLFWEENGKS